VSSEEEKNKALARRFLEAREKGDLAVVDEMMAPDYVTHARLLPGQEPGREGAVRAIAQFSGAVSKRQHTLRGPDSRGRQGGYPLHLARHPRPRRAYGRCA
jgi:ketosteroid isomerase-like protein